MGSDQYDIIILGSGPAGLSAAINAKIRNKKAIILGDNLVSQPLQKAIEINNYLGMPSHSGRELETIFKQHALDMGVEMVPKKAAIIADLGGSFSVLADDDVFSAPAVIIATGIPYKEVLPQESEFLGKGLGYCATCDGPLYRGKDVVIIGYNEEGEQEANFMSEICSRVYYLPQYRGPYKLGTEVVLIDNNKVRGIVGEQRVEGLHLKSGDTIQASGIFIIGTATAPDRLLSGLEMEGRHIKVNRQQETNITGVYAAGDCTGMPYQIAKAVGEGQVAALNASKYVSALR